MDRFSVLDMIVEKRERERAVLTLAQWVKNLTAVALVAVEAQVRSPAQCSGLKGLALPQLWCRLLIQSLAHELPYAEDVAITF